MTAVVAQPQGFTANPDGLSHLQPALLTAALRSVPSCQVRCVEKLLKAGAGMTVEQLNILLTALPALDSPKVMASACLCKYAVRSTAG